MSEMITLHRGYRYRLYPTGEQAASFERKPRWRRTTEKEFLEAVARYQSGETLEQAAHELGISAVALGARMQRRGVPRRSNAEAHRNVSFNPNIFDTDDEGSRYWAGFMLADGSIVERGSGAKTVALVLAERDHVVRFKSFLESKHKIIRVRRKPRDSWRLAIRSDALANGLARFGVVPNKTFDACPPESATCRHFWRGVVDGDGSIGRYRSGDMLRLVGSRETLEQFRLYANRLSGTAATVRPHKTIFSFGLTGENARIVMHDLYRDCEHFMPRKRNAALNILALSRGSVELAA